MGSANLSPRTRCRNSKKRFQSNRHSKTSSTTQGKKSTNFNKKSQLKYPKCEAFELHSLSWPQKSPEEVDIFFKDALNSCKTDPSKTGWQPYSREKVQHEWQYKSLTLRVVKLGEFIVMSPPQETNQYLLTCFAREMVKVVFSQWRRRRFLWFYVMKKKKIFLVNIDSKTKRVNSPWK